MKNSMLLAAVMGSVVICTSLRSAPVGKNSPTEESVGAPNQVIFLHLLGGGGTNSSIRAQRIVTTRVHLFQEFAVSVSDPDDPFSIQYEGAWTTPRIGTNGTAEARPLETMSNTGDATLAGHINLVDGKLVAYLQARNHTTLCYFHGEIELEKAFFAQGGYYRGGGIWASTFVLSTNQNCGPFLRALEDGKIHDPATVDRDGPSAKEWVQGQKNGAPRSANAEPDAPPKAAPPHR